MECQKCLILAVIAAFCIHATKGQQLKKEAYMPVSKLIKANGYKAESHKVYTEDGYILKMHRITSGFKRAKSDNNTYKKRRPILLVHGLFGSSLDFIIMGPQRSLGYLLADEGYDVWMGNLRGNDFTSHKNLTRADPKFWKYSFHEHGIYDVPAMIDHILASTKVERLLYVGYSMGTTSFFVMACQRPEYQEKIISFVALAPAVYLDNIKNLAEAALMNLNMPKTLKSSGLHSITMSGEFRNFVATGFCQAKSANEDLCMRIIYSFVGEDYDQNDWDLMPTILSRVQPCSLGQLEHYGKIAITGVFTQFNDDMISVKPYNLSEVKVPTVLIYGNNDQLTHKSQTMRLANALKESGVLVKAEMVRWPKFNHLDFIYAKNLDKLLNLDVVRLINKLYDEFS